jgi:hypothetical protein
MCRWSSGPRQRSPCQRPASVRWNREGSKHHTKVYSTGEAEKLRMTLSFSTLAPCPQFHRGAVKLRIAPPFSTLAPDPQHAARLHRLRAGSLTATAAGTSVVSEELPKQAYAASAVGPHHYRRGLLRPYRKCSTSPAPAACLAGECNTANGLRHQYPRPASPVSSRVERPPARGRVEHGESPGVFGEHLEAGANRGRGGLILQE